MAKEKNIIYLTNPSEEFNNHLNIKDNYRIIFSGKFGIGKTYFLKQFFEHHKKDYNAIFLSPVNYVVSSNEDIFELIKVDIIRELFFSGKLLAKKTSRTTTENINLFINEKPHHLFKFLTSAFKSVNPYFEITNDFFAAFTELSEKYKKYEEGLLKDFKTSEENLFDFVDSFSDANGSIFENDFITRTIDAALKNIKAKKKNILIIDDLDRIDPGAYFSSFKYFFSAQ